MSQSDFGTIDPNSKSGPQLALDLNKFRDALNSGHRGSARPVYAQAGMLWVRETSSTQWDLMFFDGDTDFVLRSVNPTANKLIGIPQSQIECLSDTLSGLDSKYVGKESATGAATLPSGTTEQRPASPVDGMTRYNSDLKDMERYQSGKWLPYNVLDKALNEAVPVTLASASNIDIGAAAANTITITGTTAIVGLGTVTAGARRTLLFTGALVLTHNAASLILPGNANITTAAGDSADFVSLGSGNWRCIGFTRFSGDPVTPTNPRLLCTAWVNFNGVGTVTIRDSYNVSSITRVGTGNYIVNFATAMTRADYSVSFGFDADSDGVTGFGTPAGTRSLYVPEALKTTSGFRATTGSNSGPAFIDFRALNLQIFGGK